MSDCTDRRFESMLHHYELGLLSDEERGELELHLMECSHCFERVNRFQPAARHFKFNPRVHKLISELAGSEADQPVEAPPKKVSEGRRRIFTPAFIPAIMVAAIVLLVLVLKPWRLEISPTEEALAVENRLAVMYFENLVEEQDTQRLGEIISSLLITDLSESKYVRVVSSQRLHDILRHLGEDDVRRVDRALASRVAEKAGVQWILTGQILQIEPALVLKYEIVEISSGNVVVSDRISGLPDENVFSLVDRFTVDIKQTLSLPEEAQREVDRSVAEVTTYSEAAYRYYLEGVELISKMYSLEAVDRFEKAVEHDSTFAMAYYYLAQYKDRSLVAKAVEYSSGATRLERLYIDALEAQYGADYPRYVETLNKIIETYPEEKTPHLKLWSYYYQIRNYNEALPHLLRAIEIDPLYKLTYNWLAYTYDRLGDFENSIRAIDRYISLEPDEANPYDSRGDLYARNGKLSQAMASYRKALQIKPNFYSSLRKLGHMYMFSGEYARADSCYQALSKMEGGQESWSVLFPPLSLVFQGKLNQAVKVYEEQIEQYMKLYPDGNPAFLIRLKAFVYLQQHNYQMAIRELERVMQLNREKSPSVILNDRNIYAQFLAESGDFEKAEQVVEEIRNDKDKSPLMENAYWYALGAIDRARGDLDAAVENFEKAAADIDEFTTRYMLARSYLESGRLSQAVRLLERQILIYDEGWRICIGTWNILLHYYLGLAYENSRWDDKAIEQYRIFLDFWGDGDPDIDEVTDARERLARLQSKT